MKMIYHLLSSPTRACCMERLRQRCDALLRQSGASQTGAQPAREEVVLQQADDVALRLGSRLCPLWKLSYPTEPDHKTPRTPLRQGNTLRGTTLAVAMLSFMESIICAGGNIQQQQQQQGYSHQITSQNSIPWRVTHHFALRCGTGDGSAAGVLRSKKHCLCFGGALLFPP